MSEMRQNQQHNSADEITVPGSDRIYSRKKLLIVMLVPLMMSLLQVSSVNNALYSMGQALAASDSQLQWVLSGYALAYGIVLVPAGRLGDIFGRGGGFVIGLAIFTLSALGIGLCNNPNLLNILRLVQGAGAGIFSPQTTGIIQQYFQGQARARAFALFGLVVSMSVAAGPVMSGGLIALLGGDIGWRASFIINFPLGVIGIILAFRWLPFAKERRKFGSHKEQTQRQYEAQQTAADREIKPDKPRIDLDPIGMGLLVVAVVAIMFPFMTHGANWIWGLLPAGVILSVIWVWWEINYQKRGNEPMVNMNLFKIRTYSYSVAISTLQFLGATSIFVVLALFLQNELGTSALQVGLVSLPNALLSAYAAMWAGKRAVEHGRGVQVLSLFVMLAGVLGAVLAAWLIANGASFWWITLPITILGFGQGAMGSANQTQTMLDVPAQHGGTAGGVQQTGQRIATAIGNAIVTAVLLAGSRVTGDPHAWYTGITLSYVLISVILVAALVIAIVFWREKYRRSPHPSR